LVVEFCVQLNALIGRKAGHAALAATELPWALLRGLVLRYSVWRNLESACSCAEAQQSSESLQGRCSSPDGTECFEEGGGATASSMKLSGTVRDVRLGHLPWEAKRPPGAYFRRFRCAAF